MTDNYLDIVSSENQLAQEKWERIYVKKYYRAVEVLSHRQPNDFLDYFIWASLKSY